ncbi:hypothetical protein AVEN_250335-1, partial [Araneus ventricosus]
HSHEEGSPTPSAPRGEGPAAAPLQRQRAAGAADQQQWRFQTAPAYDDARGRLRLRRAPRRTDGPRSGAARPQGGPHER